MPDLNSLLRWSIANSASQATSEDPNQAEDPATQQPLSLRFRPSPTNPSQGSAAALHPSDPYYRRPNTPQSVIDDISPASTPGPATPQPGETALPNGGVGPSTGRTDLTSEMLDLIMGKSDSLIMKEKMEIAVDENRDVEERVEALDDFEMLIETIDNANNMAILKLWDPIITLLSSNQDEIVRHAAWICGTAVQNNLKAQAALYIKNIFPIILSLIYPDPSSTPTPTPSAATRAKATYALSSFLKHWPLASSTLSKSSSKGYKTLQKGVSDPEQIIRRKMAFLIGTLISQSSQVYTGELPGEVVNLIEEAREESDVETNGKTLLKGLEESGVLSTLLEELKHAEKGVNPDEEFEENAMRALVNAVEGGALSEDEKRDLQGVWTKWGSVGRENRGFGGEDGVEISRVLDGI